MRASRARLAALSRSLCGTETSTERADWAWNSWSASRYMSRQRRQASSNACGAWLTASSIQPSRHHGALARSRRHPGEHGLDPGSGALCRSRVGEPLADLGQEFQAGAGAADIQHVGERPAQVLAGFGEPDRLDVRPDQVLVRQVQAGRGDRSADHIGRAAGSSTGRGRCRSRSTSPPARAARIVPRGRPAERSWPGSAARCAARRRSAR